MVDFVWLLSIMKVRYRSLFKYSVWILCVLFIFEYFSDINMQQGCYF